MNTNTKYIAGTCAGLIIGMALSGCQQTTYEMSAAEVQQIKAHYEGVCTQRGFKPGTIAHRDCSWALGHQHNNAIYAQRAGAATASTPSIMNS